MALVYQPGSIDGIVWKPLSFYHDARGWLSELFRNDDIPAEFRPVMAYISMTNPGISRGPHEHIEQADYFCFIGPGVFRVYLWDARPNSPTYGNKEVKDVGEGNPFALIVPPGVVHAYKNVSDHSGIVFNAANALYAGEGRKGWRGPKGSPDYIDEIRHEQMTGTPYQLE
jgi:dTDP-4-dehydrorhamnose 3,5-epimerase